MAAEIADEIAARAKIDIRSGGKLTTEGEAFVKNVEDLLETRAGARYDVLDNVGKRFEALMTDGGKATRDGMNNALNKAVKDGADPHEALETHLKDTRLFEDPDMARDFAEKYLGPSNTKPSNAVKKARKAVEEAAASPGGKPPKGDDAPVAPASGATKSDSAALADLGKVNKGGLNQKNYDELLDEVYRNPDASVIAGKGTGDDIVEQIEVRIKKRFEEQYGTNAQKAMDEFGEENIKAAARRLAKKRDKLITKLINQCKGSGKGSKACRALGKYGVVGGVVYGGWELGSWAIQELYNYMYNPDMFGERDGSGGGKAWGQHQWNKQQVKTLEECCAAGGQNCCDLLQEDGIVRDTPVLKPRSGKTRKTRSGKTRKTSSGKTSVNKGGTPGPEPSGRFLGMSVKYLNRRGWIWDEAAGDYYMKPGKWVPKKWRKSGKKYYLSKDHCFGNMYCKGWRGSKDLARRKSKKKTVKKTETPPDPFENPNISGEGAWNPSAAGGALDMLAVLAKNKEACLKKSKTHKWVYIPGVKAKCVKK